MKKPLVRSDLDKAHCGHEGCTHEGHEGLHLRGRCHPGSGVDVFYKDGLLHIACEECEAEVTQIVVGERLSTYPSNRFDLKNWQEEIGH